MVPVLGIVAGSCTFSVVISASHSGTRTVPEYRRASLRVFQKVCQRVVGTIILSILLVIWRHNPGDRCWIRGDYQMECNSSRDSISRLRTLLKWKLNRLFTFRSGIQALSWENLHSVTGREQMRLIILKSHRNAMSSRSCWIVEHLLEAWWQYDAQVISMYIE